ncbi:MAG: DUF488 family protein [Rhodospirillaceae bacterium]
MANDLYTLGHSRHPIARFVELLRAHEVACVADARGKPFSRFNPQFNRERLRAALADAGIGYAWLGDRLAGKPVPPPFQRPDGSVDWSGVARSGPFLDGIAELAALARSAPTAMICAEENPRHCHRRFLLTPPMEAAGFRVLHIRGDGRLEAESDLRTEAAPLFER